MWQKFFSKNKELPRKQLKIKGLTLLELVVSISLFAVLILMTTKAFQKINEIQERTTELQSIEGDLRYAMGIFADEVKNARLHPEAGDVACGGLSCANQYFCVSGGVLYLRDKNDLCVTYSLSSGNLLINRDGTNYTITSSDINVDVLNFATSTIGDRVLVQMRASGLTYGTKSINYQTAITSTTLR